MEKKQMKDQMTADMEQLTEAVEQAAKAMREVTSRLNKTMQYRDVNWEINRWTEACEELETANAVFQATFNEWITAAQ
jgi:uncharacterized protein Yka (UPF0111/DUF47 family)